MKRVVSIAVGIAIVALNARVWGAELLPGQVDFGEFTAAKGGEFVEVNIPSSLISLAARLVEKDEPEAAQLLNKLKLVRVNVIGVGEENRAEIQKRAEKVRKELTGKGWERIVAAQQKDADVGIYMKMAEKGEVQGLAAVVLDGEQHAVFVNVVGEIRPEQIAMLGEKLHLDALKKIHPAKPSGSAEKE